MCSRICIKILGEGFIHFSAGRDRGRDGKFEGRANSFPSTSKPFEGKIIIQAKHTTNPIASCSISSGFKNILKKEIPKIKSLHEKGEIDHYFIITNRKLTGGQEASIQKEIKDAVPSITSVSIWGQERIHSFLDNNKDLHDDFGLNKPRSPLIIRPDDLQKVILGFRKQIPDSSIGNQEKAGKDFMYINMDKKNAINELGHEYAGHIHEDSEKYFHTITDFLNNPRNEEYRRLYNTTTFDFKGVIIARRGDYESFDKVLEDIFTECSNDWNCHGVGKMLLKVFIHFMYCCCDIGKKE